MNNLTIRLETEKDYRAVEELTREVFGTSINPVPTSIITCIRCEITPTLYPNLHL